jgi:GTP:adenosylcobinamide-phosphate guanylyltransferase
MSIPAIVLAGERPGGNPLAQAFGEPAGVLVSVAGKPCISRAIGALGASQSVHGGLICGPDKAITESNPILQTLFNETEFSWLAPATGPADSAIASLEALPARPVLITAADHALLTPEIVDGFCHLASAQEADFVVGFVPYDLVRKAFPDSKRTVLKFADRHYCGSNLYLVRTSRGERIIELWRTLQQHRKKPWKMASTIGAKTLFGYLTGTLKVGQALRAIGDKAGCRLAHVEILNPRAAVDVDSIADHALAETILSEC